MTHTRLGLLSAAVALAMMIGCGADEPQQTPEQATLVHVGEPAPLFEGVLVDGTPFDLRDYRGEVVLLSFFATWCPPCREEMPHLERDVWERFQGREFAMIAVAREHTKADLGDFITEHGITFPVLPDPDRSIYALYADAYIPRTVLIDPTGKVIFHGTDFDPREFGKMVDLIEETLAEFRDSRNDEIPAETETEDQG